MSHQFHDKCPSCGCGQSTYKRWDQHSNGNWNEEVVFKCGEKEVYSPNFNYIKSTGTCTQNEKYLAEVQVKENLIGLLQKEVNNSSVDSEFKSKLIYSLNIILLSV